MALGFVFEGISLEIFSFYFYFWFGYLTCAQGGMLEIEPMQAWHDEHHMFSEFCS